MLPITTIFLAILLLMQVVLSITTSSFRAKLDINYGDNGDLTMLKAIRAHGNFIEYVPIVLMGLGASEIAGAPAWLLVGGGCLLIAARLSHAAHMFGMGGNATRIFGAGMTTLLMIVLALFLLGKSIGLI